MRVHFVRRCGNGTWQTPFPNFTPPEEKQPNDYLRELCLVGLHDRYAGNEKRMPDGQLSQEVMDRLERELNVINTLASRTTF